MSDRPVRPGPHERASAGGDIQTFLIADVRGYTSFTRSQGDEAAARLAAAFAEITREGVEAHGGTVVELRGDEAMATFGSPRRALRAAVELQRIFADEVALKAAIPLLVGIGIDAGEAVPVEGGFRGGALNLAARLCANAGPGETLVSSTVAHLAGAVPGVTLTDSGPLKLKGLDQPVTAMRVESIGASTAAREGIADAAARAEVGREVAPELDPVTPVFGRDVEARALRWRWRQARAGGPRAGGPRAVFMRGPTGSGKTRLLAEPAAVAAGDGARVMYATATRGADSIRDTLDSVGDVPAALVVLDDLEQLGDSELGSLQAGLGSLNGGRVLVLGAYSDEGPGADAVSHLVRTLGADAEEIGLRPLDESAVRSIGRLYLDDTEARFPSLAILEASSGWPERIHVLAAEWARTETTRRLGEAASNAAVGRSELRRHEAELTANVVDAQLVRERARLYASRAELADDAGAESPFKGLAPFDVGDAELFFGRERLVAELVGRLASGPFVGVVGPSGSGKSSAVRAGLVPALAANVLDGSAAWPIALFRPGEHPIREADRAVYVALDPSLRTGMRAGDDPIAAALAALPDGKRLVIVVDQFEELFTLCDDEDERRRFIESLVLAAADGRASVVVAIRADFYGRCAAYRELAEHLSQSHVLVGPMTVSEYRRAVEGPAQRAGLRVEPALIDVLVGEVVDEPGALPLLSTALLELWQHRDGRRIGMDTYNATGGVRGAVARLAESTYGRLSETEQAIARSILLRLSALDGETPIRRRVPLNEFDVATNPDVAQVLSALTDARLLTVGDGFVEIAHEALLREWPRLAAWLDEDRAGRALHQHLTGAAAQWAAAGRDPGELYRGARLASSLDWTARHALELNELERAFLAESRVASERDADRQRRTNRRLRVLLASVAVFLVVAIVAGALAVVERGEAERAALTAESERAAAERAATAAVAQRLGAQALTAKDLDVSLLLARAGAELDDSQATQANLLAALLRSPAAIGVWRPLSGRLLGVSASPDGTALIVGNNNGEQALVDAATGDVRGTAPPGDFAGFTNVNEPWVWRGQPDQPATLTVYDATMAPKRTLQFPPDVRNGFFWTSDLRQLAYVVDGGRSIKVVDLETHEELRRVSAPAGELFFDVYIFDSGHMLMFLSGDPLPDEEILFSQPINAAWWEPGATEPTTRLTLRPPFAWTLTPDLSTIAAVTEEGSLMFFDVATGESRPAHGRHNAPITGLSFSPDGQTLVTGGDDRLAMVWDVASGDIREVLAGHTGRVFAPALTDRDGHLTAYTVGLDGLLIAWDLSGQRRLGQPFEAGSGNRLPDNPVEDSPTFAISPDGKLLAVTQSNGQVVIRDTTKLAVVQELAATAEGAPNDVAFSLDGTRLAIAGYGANTVALWDTGTWTPLHHNLPGIPDEPVGKPVECGPTTTPATCSRSVAFSPDGRMLAAAFPPFRFGLFDASTGQPFAEPIDVGNAAVFDLAFSPDSSLVAAAITSVDPPSGLARVWRVSDRQELYTVDVDSGYGRPGAVAFSPDGRLLATGGGTGDARFWDAATGEAAARSIQASAGWILSLDFDNAGSTLVSAGTDGTVRLLDTEGRSQFAASLPGIDNEWVNAAFTSDDRYLFAVYGSGRGFRWDVSPTSWEAAACRIAGRDLTTSEWEQYIGDRPYMPSCQ